jgi:hypothetical protein
MRNFVCYRVPDGGLESSSEIAVLIKMVGAAGFVAAPGDWVTVIEAGGGRQLVRLSRNGRVMKMCQMSDADGDPIEEELWVWPLPNGQAIYLEGGITPRLTTLSVDKEQIRGTWLPGMAR